MIQIKIPEDLQVNCATQLLFDRAMTWWETIQLRRATEALTWIDFKFKLKINSTPSIIARRRNKNFWH